MPSQRKPNSFQAGRESSFVLRAVVLLACIVPLAGCNDGSAPASMFLPRDWQDGTMLMPSQMGGDHGGGRGADLYPVKPMEKPAWCKAFRDNATLDTDSCTIEDSKYDFQKQHGPWNIAASWASCPTHDFNGCHNDDRPGPYEQRVVAFDRHNDPVAWWDGRMGPDTMYYTE